MARKRIDLQILIITLLLLAFGMLMLFSASFYIAQDRFGNGYYYIFKQLQGALIGGVLMVLFMFIDYRFWKKYALVIYIACAVLLLLVWIPGLGKELNEARRWVQLGPIGFQPSEIAKFGLIIVIAAMIDNYGPERMRSFKRGVMPVVVAFGIIAGLIFIQPNFSVFVCVALTCFAMLVFGGMRAGQLLIVTGVGLGAGTGLMLLESYRLVRLKVFQNPWAYPKDGGYQLVQSLYALGSGGIFGTGLGASRQKFLFLPYGESDFIFAIIAEEWGVVGAIILLGVFFYLIVRGYRVAMRAPDTFGSILAAGITTVIALQVMINIAVVTSSIPPTGLPLPFISAGTTSIIAFLAATGLLLSVSRAAS